MKIFFIIDDTLILLPEWLDKVIVELEKNEEIVGISPLTNKGRSSWDNYLVKQLPRQGVASLIRLIQLVFCLKLQKILFDLRLIQQPASIKQVAKKHRLKVIRTKNVNRSDYLEKVEKLKPDIIVSSCSQIFGKRLLELSKIACINRHSSLLPSYGGLLPIFWALLNDEKEIGVTVHHMVKKIDRGPIIFQKAFPVEINNTFFSHYKRAYQESVEATIKAIQIIKNKSKPVVIKRTKPSYYTFPEIKDWERFWKKGYKFI